MTTAVYPGSFDPVTLGHYDIIKRSSKIVDRLIIGILVNPAKSPLLSIEERVKAISSVTKGLPNVEIRPFTGLIIDFARDSGASVIVRGMRAVTDFDYELQFSQINRMMAPEIDTLFLPTNLNYSYLSSSIVKEIAMYQGDLSAFLQTEIAGKVKEKIISREMSDE